MGFGNIFESSNESSSSTSTNTDNSNHALQGDDNLMAGGSITQVDPGALAAVEAALNFARTSNEAAKQTSDAVLSGFVDNQHAQTEVMAGAVEAATATASASAAQKLPAYVPWLFAGAVIIAGLITLKY